MKFTIISIFPDLIENFFSKGVINQAIKKNLLQFDFVNPRDFATDNYKTVDDRPFGGGDGMIMKAEPLAEASQKILKAENEKPFFVYMSPQGRKLNDSLAVELSGKKHLVFVCGRYGGVDQRYINEYIDMELSIGDYVISGGEAAAIVAIDAIARKIEGVLGHKESAALDSFSDSLLEEPQYTRPKESLNMEVPEVLTSGNHKNIQAYKKLVAKLVTFKKRPDLIDENEISFLHESYLSLSEKERKSLGLEDLFQ
jgi:tRNA (guanine37-N1)-methyltransferase